MKRWKWKEVLAEIQSETDLYEEDDFATEEDLMRWFNRAIDKIESKIHRLAKDYFIKNIPFPLVAGTKAYSLPSDIYAGMIRGLEYDSGTKNYSIEKLRGLDEIAYEDESLIGDFSYLVFNGDTPQINFYPTPLKDYSDEITLYYIRNAKRLEYSIADRGEQEVDIPEFTYLCVLYVIAQVHKKEKQWQDYGVTISEFNEGVREMEATLSQKEQGENDNKIEVDTEAYCDHI